MTDDPQLAPILTIRNSRLIIAIILLFAVASMLTAIGTALEAFDIIFQMRGEIFLRILSAVQWAGCAFGLASIGVSGWTAARNATFHQITFEPAGLHIRLGSKRKPLESFFSWEEISAVTRDQFIYIVAKDGRATGYGAYDFFRYNKIARLIASRANRPITVLKPSPAPTKPPAKIN